MPALVDLAVTAVGTLLGAALGIPAGLYVNRRVERRQVKLAGDARRRLLVEVCTLVEQALNVNLVELKEIAQGIEEFGAQSASITVDFSQAAWESAGAAARECLPVDVRGRLARYFEQIARLNALAMEHGRLATDNVLRVQSEVAERAQAVRHQEIDRVVKLRIEDSERLLLEVARIASTAADDVVH